MKTLLKATLGAMMLLVLAATPGWSQCNVMDPSVSLITNGTTNAGVWVYGLTQPANSCFDFTSGTTLTFTGMTGVTGTSVSGTWTGIWATDGFTATSATFNAPFGDFNENFASTPTTLGNFNIDSSSPAGSINWSVVLGEDPLNGSVTGPTGAGTTTPEPSSLLLLLAGMAALGLGVWFRGKALRGAPQMVA